MKLSAIPFSQLRQLLHGLDFTESRLPKGWRFEHPGTGIIFLFRPYRLNEKVNFPNLMSVESHLDWHGLMDPATFQNLLAKTPA